MDSVFLFLLESTNTFPSFLYLSYPFFLVKCDFCQRDSDFFGAFVILHFVFVFHLSINEQSLCC